MKLTRNILAISLLVLLTSCIMDEAPIIAKEEPNKRESMYDTLAVDTTLRYISKYYYNYDKELIIDPDSSDYWYNFSSSYKTTVGISQPSALNAAKTVKVLDELLIKWYDSNFISKYFPKKILVGNDVYTYTYVPATQTYNKVQVLSYSGAYFLLIKAMSLDTMSVSTKKTIALGLNSLLWSNISKFRPFLPIGASFYSYGKDNALYDSPQTGNEWTGGKTYDPTHFVTNKMMYSSGFVTCKKEFGTYFGKPYISKVTLPKEDEDLISWINFVLTVPDAEIAALKTQYSLTGTPENPTVFEKKFNIVVNAFAAVGLDYKNLGYKPTN